MLRLVGLAAQATLILLALYNAVTALWGWPNRPPAPSGSGRRRLRVVIPAHNEANVIAALLDDLGKADYPEDVLQVWVLADRCEDGTAGIAMARGVSVAERLDGEGGKGAALTWYLGSHPLAEDEALVVFDADNRVPVDALRRIADEIDAGHQVLQCYLDVTDTPGSLLAEASALSYWAGNRMVQLARSNLGWSADLGGTGMAMTARSITDAGGFTTSLTEDQDLGVRLLLAGHRVEWLHDVRIEDEKPRSLRVAVRQRARWMAGKRATRRKHLRSLLTAAPSMARIDMAIRLVQPGRSFVALMCGLLTMLAALTRSDWLFPWPAWAAVTAVQVLQPVPFLARDGVPPARLARYPLLALLAALWVPVRLVSTRVEGWYHTPHQGRPTSGHEEGTVP
jgi:cellulose synthase/poly-beta-1,6-N-acetylglucosamine synthase-like glycosyltransferase